MERKYSLSEIDQMRDAIATLPNGHAINVEERLRTYLFAGVEPAELWAENKRLWAIEGPYRSALNEMARQNAKRDQGQTGW